MKSPWASGISFVACNQRRPGDSEIARTTREVLHEVCGVPALAYDLAEATRTANGRGTGDATFLQLTGMEIHLAQPKAHSRVRRRQAGHRAPQQGFTSSKGMKVVRAFLPG